jgi:hypothetical protein
MPHWEEVQLSSPSNDSLRRPLSRIVLEHLSAIVVVGAVLFVAALLLGKNGAAAPESADSRIDQLMSSGLDWSKPLHREIFRDTYRMLTNASDHTVDSLMRAIESARVARLIDPELKEGGARQHLSWGMMKEIAGMYATFLVVLAAAMVCTYVAARAVAIRKFINAEQGRSSSMREYFFAIEKQGPLQAMLRLDLLGKALLRGIGSLVLFAPAYVIAYSLRTRLDTGNVLFLILLAIISNGVLVYSAGRLYALLVAESRKGYVQTALVKGLSGDYDWGHAPGFTRMALLSPARIGKGHVFHAIFVNAQLQFIPSLKEHVSFMVTGLVIIEMALNIKGHLCYALLQHMLYREYDIAIAIVFLIFVAVKIAELCIDIWHNAALGRYDNAG